MNTLLHLPRQILFACMAAAWAGPVAADPLALTKSFEGNINFVGTQASLQSKNGGAKACDLKSSAQAGITLPANATVVAAILYWAGTGEVDPEVSLNSTMVTAPAERRYASTIDGLRYFAAAADVTAMVRGSGSFSFGGLSVSTADVYCAKQQKENAMIAGFALAVVYAEANERYRAVNFYEGMQAVKNTSITVPMRDYTPPARNAGIGRFGYLVWEGDKTGQQKGDTVSFGGQQLLQSPFIHKDDAFNSKSGANADEGSNGIDFDIVNVAPPASRADADAVFTTKDDRVLLSMAALAVPSKPADLSIKKSQAGEFKLGNEITYTLTVTNEGPRADKQVTVKDSLPAALGFVSAGAADWACARAGQLVTCSYGKPLTPGASASVQIKAKILVEGKIVNTAEVSGSGDAVSGNNSSTVEGDTAGVPAAKGPFVFTVGACAPEERIKAAGGQGCALFKGPVYAGSKPTIYVTYARDGVARPLSATKASSETLRFSLECNNPTKTALVGASYAGQALSTCVDDGSPVTAGGGAAAKLDFAANTPSVKAEFYYPDVGLVSLRLSDGAGNVARTGFASLPTSLRAAYTNADGAVNPGLPSLTDPAFAQAGEAFVVTISAHGTDDAALPNFGQETGTFALGESLALRAHGDSSLEQELLLVQGVWEASMGTLSRPYAWHEAGLAHLSPFVSAYLGERDPATGAPLEIVGDKAAVGRFYPQYFVTEASSGSGCLPRMNCPAGVISRAVFSGQDFDASIHAYGRHAKPLQRFTDALVPAIALSAVAAPGQAVGAPGTLSDKGPAQSTGRKVGFQLPVRFNARAGTQGWTAPSALYLRAEAREQRKTLNGAQEVKISSLRDVASASREGGIMVINGRLMVANAIGSTASTTPVPLRAQFWTGSAWELQSLVNEAEAFTGTVDFEACRRGLRDPYNFALCHPVLKIEGTAKAIDPFALPLLEGGKAGLVLAPVIGKSGSADIFVNGRDYLPSTIGRVSFGQFKSPVIYVREMY